MTAEFWVTQAFNGLSYGALLFLLASGLSLIFGVMRIVNLAHGSYFMLGGYVGLSVSWRTGSYVLALLAGAVVVALVGVAMERVFLRRLPGQTLGQVLMTIGFALIFQDLALLIWGGDPYTIRVPAMLSGVVTAGPGRFPIYRIFIVAVAVVVGAVLWLALDRTRVGAMIRAAVDDAEMAQGSASACPAFARVFALARRSPRSGASWARAFSRLPRSRFRDPAVRVRRRPSWAVSARCRARGRQPMVGSSTTSARRSSPDLSYFTCSRRWPSSRAQARASSTRVMDRKSSPRRRRGSGGRGGPVLSSYPLPC